MAEPKITCTIETAAKAMGVTAASARSRFRKAGVKPRGPAGYGWSSQKEMQADIAKTSGPVAKKKEAPAKKAASKKAMVKKTAGKKKEAPAKKAEEDSDGD